MTCIRRNLNTQNCCNQWQKGIRTIDGQYPDDNREFKITAGAGILITPITAGILITNTTDPAALEAGSNIELTPNGDHLQIGVVDGPTFNDDTTINGDLNVNGNIYNQGASYESHMEQVYTTDDYIIMRDNAVTGLAAGSYAGFQVKLYDGVNDGRLVIDNSGVARVGDVGDEQPLLTRDEAANLNNGALLKWDAANMKAVDEGTVGSDTKPIKIVNGVATPVTKTVIQGLGKIQYGQTTGSNTSQDVIFPEPFTNRPFVFLAVLNSNDSLLWSTSILQISATGFKFESKYSAMSGNVPTGYNQYLANIQWIAIGE